MYTGPSRGEDPKGDAWGEEEEEVEVMVAVGMEGGVGGKRREKGDVGTPVTTGAAVAVAEEKGVGRGGKGDDTRRASAMSCT